MPHPFEPLQVHVEGKSDLYTLVNLLQRNGVEPLAQRIHFTSPNPESGVEALLATIPQQIQNSAGRTVGFVVDANGDLIGRWSAVRNRLAGEGVDSPKTPPPSGFIGLSETWKTRVGVWLMPDNRSAGNLEHFLLSLVPTTQTLYQFAEQCTDQARSDHGAGFSESDQLKAMLACWLAWQENPGRPYGTAIHNHYLGCDSPVALEFVAWFRTLFALDLPATPTLPPP